MKCFSSHSKVLALFFCAVSNFTMHTFHMSQLLSKYNRPITFLEVSGAGITHVQRYAPLYDGVFIGLLLNTEDTRGFQDFIGEHFTNVVLLQPRSFEVSYIQKMAECEHLDIVFMHDIELFGQESSEYVIEQSLNLGDYLIVDIPKAQAYCFDFIAKYLVWSEQRNQCTRFCFHKPKIGLTHNIIASNFNAKVLYKQDGTQSAWVPGINLITALMLDVQYPTNALLRASMKKMKTLNHNDLVMSNMIVQGNTLVAIDFGDTRRNADSKKCLKETIKVFNWYSRLTESDKLFKQYCKSLKSNH